MKATCPKCGSSSDRILAEFDRVYPAPAVRIVRYRCGKPTCIKPRRVGYPKMRTTWDVETERIETSLFPRSPPTELPSNPTKLTR